MKPYADSNFFPRLYIELDAGSLEASLLAEPVVTGHLEPLPITRLHRLEVLNAFEMTAYQSAKQGQHRITREAAAIVQSTFRDDCREQSFLRLCTPVEAAVDRQYEELVLRHTAARGFRNYDLLNVSQAFILCCDTSMKWRMPSPPWKVSPCARRCPEITRTGDRSLPCRSLHSRTFPRMFQGNMAPRRGL